GNVEERFVAALADVLRDGERQGTAEAASAKRFVRADRAHLRETRTPHALARQRDEAPVDTVAEVTAHLDRALAERSRTRGLHEREHLGDVAGREIDQLEIISRTGDVAGDHLQTLELRDDVPSGPGFEPGREEHGRVCGPG